MYSETVSLSLTVSEYIQIYYYIIYMYNIFRMYYSGSCVTMRNERFQNLHRFLVSLYGYRLSIGSHELGEGVRQLLEFSSLTYGWGLTIRSWVFPSISTFILPALGRPLPLRGDLQTCCRFFVEAARTLGACW